MSVVKNPRTGSPGMMTYTGKVVYPFQFEAQQANLLDIFVHLAHSFRFNGALGAASPSIMAHSINAYLLAAHRTFNDDKFKDWSDERLRAFVVLALIHDWPEYILGDITRPVKMVAVTEDYAIADAQILGALAHKYFGLTSADFLGLDQELQIVDNGCLFHELCQHPQRRLYAETLNLSPFVAGIHDIDWRLLNDTQMNNRNGLFAMFRRVLMDLKVPEELLQELD